VLEKVCLTEPLNGRADFTYGRLRSMLLRIKSVTPLRSAAGAIARTPHSAILLLCLLALALNLGPAFDNRFHPDEALFSSWAIKIAHSENVWLTGLPIDKPPLLIYATAISFVFFGQTEIAARLPNLMASVISVLLVYQLSKRKGARPSAPTLIAPIIFALSPFVISFAPTAFLDPLMIMFGLAALVAASRHRMSWAGILLGLSFATKVQGLFFAPLLIVFYQPRSHKDSKNLQKTLGLRAFVVSLLSFAAIALLLLLWDRLRGGIPFWLQQSINYGGIRAIYPSEVGARLIGWLSFLPYFFGPIVGATSLIVIPIGLWLDLTRFARSREALIDLLLLAYLIGFIAFHWLLAFQIWDRYLLLIVPLAAILISRFIIRILTSIKDRPGFLSSLLPVFFAVILSLPFSIAAAQSQYAIGGDHVANDGIDQVANYLAALPSGTVVYDHWLAWELSYYLSEGHVYLAYFETPNALADDLRALDRGEDRYVVFPISESPDKSIEAIKSVGFQMMPVFTTINRFNQTSFTIFKIIPSNH
jgi:4-amino-4-deoxy-L-arabinose transferase-like glycosyltransferase